MLGGSLVGWQGTQPDRQLAHSLEESLADLCDESLRASTLARLAAASIPAESTLRMAREAIAMAERVGDERTELDVIHTVIGVMVPLAPPRERRALNQRARELAEWFDEPAAALRAHLHLVFDHLELGDLIGADIHHRAYNEMVDRLRLPRARWVSAMLRALRALLHGDVAEHAAALASAHNLARLADEPVLVTHALARHRICAAAVFGNDDDIAFDRSAIAMELAARGSVQRQAALGCQAADIAWTKGNHQLAATLYPWLAAHDTPLPTFHVHGFAVAKPSAHAAMLCAATLGNLDAAAKHYEVALELLRRLDARPYEAWLRLDFASVLAKAGLRGDAPRQLLEGARAITEALGTKLSPRIAAAEAALRVVC